MRATCSVQDCAGRVRAKGLCPSHYRSDWRARRGQQCVVDGCARLSDTRGLCRPHYARLRKHGDPTAWRGVTHAEITPRNPNGAGSELDGYHVLGGMHGHPLASAKGYVRVHRLILWTSIGPGEHPCAHCGAVVSWDLKHPQVGALVVDHLDGNTRNNEIRNLVPSCNPCNVRRTS